MSKKLPKQTNVTWATWTLIINLIKYTEYTKRRKDWILERKEIYVEIFLAGVDELSSLPSFSFLRKFPWFSKKYINSSPPNPPINLSCIPATDLSVYVNFKMIFCHNSASWETWEIISEIRCPNGLSIFPII